MKNQTKIESVFEAKQPDDLSHRLGRAIAWACDMRLTRIGMPLGDFEIAMDEGSPFASKSKVKVVEATSSGEESPERPPSEMLKKRLKGGLSELKKILSTNWGEPRDGSNDFPVKI
jgi:hypothetical protein